ncbi:hypothetical protein FHS29_002194 [Saccharothrix tamanrassetensis]|uniref:Uncharacterized protein n=1 Tax=Saccharothrix tamanrassetensis TaxID=1051531 RepID=A0A841CF74_9PSEU|nr:hypothetical protein [Saccharothrix tamanrassetensis]
MRRRLPVAAPPVDRRGEPIRHVVGRRVRRCRESARV